MQCRLRDFHRSVQSCGDPGAADDGVVVGEDRSEVIDGVLDQVTTNDAYPEFADLRDVVLLGRDGGVDGGPPEQDIDDRFRDASGSTDDVA